MIGIDTAIAGGIGLLGDLFGGGGPSPEEIIAQNKLNAAKAQFLDQPVYNAPALEYQPINYGQAITPEAQTVSEDPNIRNAQMAALNSLLTRSNEGVTAEEQRAQDLSRRQQEQTTQGQTEAIMNNMAARGVGGSGMEFALRQDAAQQAADTASQQGMARESTNAAQKLSALQALMSGQSDLRGQDYKVNSGNTDIINKFALENSRRQNAINASNTELANQAQMANKEAARTDYTTAYNQDVAKRKALAGQDQNQSQFALGQDVARRSEDAKTMGNVGSIAGGLYNYATSPSSTSGTGSASTLTSSNSGDDKDLLNKNKQWFA